MAITSTRTPYVERQHVALHYGDLTDSNLTRIPAQIGLTEVCNLDSNRMWQSVAY